MEHGCPRRIAVDNTTAALWFNGRSSPNDTVQRELELPDVRSRH